MLFIALIIYAHWVPIVLIVYTIVKNQKIIRSITQIWHVQIDIPTDQKLLKDLQKLIKEPWVFFFFKLDLELNRLLIIIIVLVNNASNSKANQVNRFICL